MKKLKTILIICEFHREIHSKYLVIYKTYIYILYNNVQIHV